MRLLKASGSFWRLLKASGGSWRLLEAPGALRLLEAPRSKAGGTLEGQDGGRLEAGWRASGKSLEIENSIDSRHDGVSMEGNRSIHRTIGRGQGRRKLRHVQSNIELFYLLEASRR